MAIGTANIGLDSVKTEFGKTTRSTGLSLKDYVNAAIETDSNLGFRPTEKRLSAFSNYNHSGCVFKFDPFQPTVTSKTAVDLYDDTLPYLPAQSDSNIYTENYNANSSYIPPSGGSIGYLDITGTTTPRGIRWTAVSSGTSYKHLPATLAFWIKLDTLPSGGTVIVHTNADDTGTYNYSGIRIILTATGEIRVALGDNTGRASSDRKTFLGNSGVIGAETWYFVTVHVNNSGGLNVEATISAYDDTSKNNTNILTQGTSGTATTVVNNSTLHLVLGADVYDNNAFNLEFGHFYVFDSFIVDGGAGSVLEDIFTSTKGFYIP